MAHDQGRTQALQVERPAPRRARRDRVAFQRAHHGRVRANATGLVAGLCGLREQGELQASAARRLRPRRTRSRSALHVLLLDRTYHEQGNELAWQSWAACRRRRPGGTRSVTSLRVASAARARAPRSRRRGVGAHRAQACVRGDTVASPRGSRRRIRASTGANLSPASHPCAPRTRPRGSWICLRARW